MKCLIGLVVLVYLFSIHDTGVAATGCLHDGVLYPPDTQISRVYDEEAHECSGIYCTSGAELVYWRGATCEVMEGKRKLSSLTSLTSLAKRTENEGMKCHSRGTTYPPNSVITSYFDAINTYCYGSYCTGSGQVVLWADLNCAAQRTRSSSLQSRKSDVALDTSADENVNKDGGVATSRAVPPKRAKLLATLLNYYRRRLEHS